MMIENEVSRVTYFWFVCAGGEPRWRCTHDSIVPVSTPRQFTLDLPGALDSC
jgi:hypothetical protein